jgi:hypothetical protein
MPSAVFRFKVSIDSVEDLVQQTAVGSSTTSR